MTRSELFAVMAGGMASVAGGSVLGGYAGWGVELKYLIAASFMAPRVACYGEVVPERSTPSDYDHIELDKADQSNVIDALASGAMNGMKSRSGGWYYVDCICECGIAISKHRLIEAQWYVRLCGYHVVSTPAPVLTTSMANR